MTLPWLPPGQPLFPPPAQALDEPNGLLAVGGELSPPWLVEAYRQGIFPWFEEEQPILWWSPDPRLVLRPDQLHLSRTLARRLRRENFSATADHCFDRVIESCSGPREGSDGTWITAQMKRAYAALHQLGIAHSVEAWRGDTLLGGLYGIALGRVFFGESMFSLHSDGSKLALVALCRQLQRWDYQLIDCQVETGHLSRMGAATMERSEFLSELARLIPAQNLPNLDSGGNLLSNELAKLDSGACTPWQFASDLL